VTPTTPRHPRHRELLHRSALLRLTAAIVLFGLVAALTSLRFGRVVSLLAGWDAGGLWLLAVSWSSISQCDDMLTRERAAAQDPGRTAVYVIVTLTSVASLIAATVLSRQAGQVAPREAHLLTALCLITVAVSWTVTHTSFTLRYAHLYYREGREGIGGVEFPGSQPPTYFDFAYLAFTIGMCFQVSDMTVTSPQIRRTVLLHAILSFAYNTAILAFALNLAFSSPS
jgi:uncharacterized membrane protein